jgi:hypothetical protein
VFRLPPPSVPSPSSTRTERNSAKGRRRGDAGGALPPGPTGAGKVFAHGQTAARARRIPARALIDQTRAVDRRHALALPAVVMAMLRYAARRRRLAVDAPRRRAAWRHVWLRPRVQRHADVRRERLSTGHEGVLGRGGEARRHGRGGDRRAAGERNADPLPVGTPGSRLSRRRKALQRRGDRHV